ncbi:MAG: spore maturation protein [Christensenellaceae bacterium]|jgi:spore maturation protein B|nr:spore maturation protein [Christensenellaceae bacterium]
MSAFIIPIFILFLFIYAFCKKTDTFFAFTKGGKDAVGLILEIIPFIVAILVAVELFKASGLLVVLCNMMSPVFSFLGIPPELVHFVFLKPFSGAGSLALYDTIVLEYGTASYITRVASAIAGSSETVFYISAIYFSKTKIKNLGLAIPIALFCTFASAILAAWVCRIM